MLYSLFFRNHALFYFILNSVLVFKLRAAHWCTRATISIQGELYRYWYRQISVTIHRRIDISNTALVCSVKVFKTVRERRKNHYKHEAPTARDCLALHLMSPMRRGGCCWLLWWLKSWNGLKRLVNKLQNVMFSNTHTDCMYSNSSAWARGARVQSPKREKNLL